MATPVSTCCTQQLKDHQLISIFFKENYILLIKAQLPQLWYSVWIREGVSGISRRGTERLLTQSQPLCTVYSIAFPPEEQRGVSCISDEFWSQLLADIDANVHRSVLQSIQCIWWKGPHSSARTVMWATCNCTKVNEETSGNPIKRLLIVYSRTTAPPSSFLFPPVKIQDCFNSQQHFDMRLLAVDARKPRG